jgi:hypothetical protein
MTPPCRCRNALAAALRNSLAASRARRSWLAAGDSYGTAFSLLQTYAQPLLNLVTSEEFLAGERSGLPFLR